jgi:hypothetical protein
MSSSTAALSHRKPASSKMSHNSRHGQGQSNRHNLECHRQYINASSNPSPKYDMQESVIRANATQWKFITGNCCNFHSAFHDTIVVNSTWNLQELHLVKPLLPVGVEGLQPLSIMAFRYSSYSIQFLFPSKSSVSNLPKSVRVFLWVQSSVLSCQAILGYLMPQSHNVCIPSQVCWLCLFFQGNYS